MWEEINNIKYYKKNWYLMVCIRYSNKDGYVIEINSESETLPITGENITLREHCGRIGKTKEQCKCL